MSPAQGRRTPGQLGQDWKTPPSHCSHSNSKRMRARGSDEWVQNPLPSCPSGLRPAASAAAQKAPEQAKPEGQEHLQRGCGPSPHAAKSAHPAPPNGPGKASGEGQTQRSRAHLPSQRPRRCSSRTDRACRRRRRARLFPIPEAAW
eukprot:4398669-Pyramimonas_sp.AAC.1